MYNTQPDFRPLFEGKIEVHMHNMHPHFYGAVKLLQASYDFISHSLITWHGRDHGGRRHCRWEVWTQTFLLPAEIPYTSTGGSRCVHGHVSMHFRTRPRCPHLWTRMRSNVRTRTCLWTHSQRVCVRSQTRSRKCPCLHISAALPVPFPITLPGELREGREEQLAVTSVPRTSRGPVGQLKLDMCALSASSNSYECLHTTKRSGKSGPKDQVALHYYYTSPSHWCTTHEVSKL